MKDGSEGNLMRRSGGFFALKVKEKLLKSSNSLTSSEEIDFGSLNVLDVSSNDLTELAGVEAYICLSTLLISNNRVVSLSAVLLIPVFCLMICKCNIYRWREAKKAPERSSTAAGKLYEFRAVAKWQTWM